MKFKSRKDILFQLLGFSIIGFFVGIVLFSMFSDGIENYIFKWTDIFMLVVVGFLIWFGLGTNYELTQTELKYKSGPIKGKIETSKMDRIIANKCVKIQLFSLCTLQ